MQGRCGASGFRSSAKADAPRRLRPLQRRHRQPAPRLPRKPPRSASPNGEPTRRACKPVASPKRPTSSSAGLAAAMPSATAPEPKPTAAAPPPPSRPAPTATQAAPAPAPQRPAPTTTAAPVPAPAQQPSAPSDNATLEAGQFADEASAKARCPSDTVVWVNLPSKVYHFAGTRSYGTTKRGAYMCEKEAIAAEDRASKTEKHP